MKLEFSRQFFEKYSNIKFHENRSIGSRVVSCAQTEGRTDTTKLIVAFRNFSNAPKNRQTGSQSETCQEWKKTVLETKVHNGWTAVREKENPEQVVIRYHFISTLTGNSISKLLQRGTRGK